MLTFERLESLLLKFPNLTVGLVGDLFLDRYLEIDPALTEVSIETGLDAYQVTRVRNSPGALGTVMNNLAALGVGRIVPLTVIGDDGHGYDLSKSVAELGCETAHLIACADRATPTYTKPVVMGRPSDVRELNRLDVRTRQPVADDVLAEVRRRLDLLWSECDGLVVMDQISDRNHGVIHDSVREHLRHWARRDTNKVMLVDSRAFLHEFDFGMVKANEGECRASSGCDDPRQAARWLAGRNAQPVFCTRGADGILLASPDGKLTEHAAVPVDGPIDIVGAGDSASSAIIAVLLAGGNEIEAAETANLVASLTIQQIGTTGTASPRQILDRWKQVN